MSDTEKWADTRKKCLDMHARGMTRSEIAKALNKSRNSVIGVLYRLGIRDDGARKVSAGRSRSRKVSTIRQSHQPARLARPPRAAVVVDIDPAILSNEASDLQNPSPDRQTILVRDQSGRLHANDKFHSEACRWPVGDPQSPEFHFCGRTQVPGLPYCQVHSARAFISAQPRVRKSETETSKILEPTS